MLRSNVFWSLLDAGLNGFVAIAAQLLIARLIGPEQLGIAVAATAIFQIVQTALGALFHDSIVQRPTLSGQAITTASVVGLVLGVFAAGLMVLGGRLAAGPIDEPMVATLAVPLAATLPLLGFAGPSFGLLTRRRAFRTIAIRSVTSQMVAFTLGVGLAVAGQGALASIGHVVSTVVVASILSLFAARDGFARGFAWSETGPILKLGVANSGNALMFIARYRLFALLVGASGGTAFLGQVHMAFRLVDALRDLTTAALHRLLLSSYSQIQNDLGRIQSAFGSAMQMVSLLVVPFFLGLAVTIGPIIRLLLGPGWDESVAPAAILAVLAAWSMYRYPAAAVNMAKGRSFMLLGTNALLTVTTIGLIALLPPRTVLEAALLWVGPIVLLIPLTIRQADYSLHLGVAGQFKPGLRGILVAAGAAIASLQPMLWQLEPPDSVSILAIRVGTFVVVWLALSAILLRAELGKVRGLVLRR